ncbi:MAG: MaoC/PaaZ C-terminal domain-containing protein [Myxococcales bacterium]
MRVPNLHILEQREAFGAMVRVVRAQVTSRLGVSPAELRSEPLVVTLPPLKPALVRDFVAYLGGDPRRYGNTLPPHLAPQWSIGVAASMLESSGLPLRRVINLGCSFEVRDPLPADEPLLVTAEPVTVDDDGRRAIATGRLVSTTRSAPRGLVTDGVSLFPRERPRAAPAKAPSKPVKARPVLPTNSALTCIKLGRHAGLEFAKLTGDFNPIHWIPQAARAAGFRGVVLQGYGTVAHTIEALNSTLFGGDVHRLGGWSCRLLAPVVLPAELEVYAHAGDVVVVDKASGHAVLTGQYRANTPDRA